MNPLRIDGRVRRTPWLAWLFAAMISLGCSGCAMFAEPEPERPRTVTDWMKGERLGREFRPTTSS